MKQDFAALLADNYTQAFAYNEETAYQLRSIVSGIAYRLFIKSSESEEAKAELERLTVLAASDYGISISALIKERLDWVKWWESRYGH